MPRSAIVRSRARIGAIPAPPPTNSSSVSASRSVKTPNGPVSSSRSPTASRSSRNRENRPSGYTLITNSSVPSLLEVLAIENERTWSVPGTAMSMYWPGKNLTSAGSTRRSTRCRMSCVTGSFETTSATACWIGRPERIISSS